MPSKSFVSQGDLSRARSQAERIGGEQAIMLDRLYPSRANRGGAS